MSGFGNFKIELVGEFKMLNDSDNSIRDCEIKSLSLSLTSRRLFQSWMLCQICIIVVNKRGKTRILKDKSSTRLFKY
jgi:hypothetical protein